MKKRWIKIILAVVIGLMLVPFNIRHQTNDRYDPHREYWTFSAILWNLETRTKPEDMRFWYIYLPNDTLLPDKFRWIMLYLPCLWIDYNFHEPDIFYIFFAINDINYSNKAGWQHRKKIYE